MASTENTASSRSVLQDDRAVFAPGKVFQVSGRLCVAFFTDEEQCLRQLRSNPSHYYFSNACPTVRAPPPAEPPASSSTMLYSESMPSFISKSRSVLNPNPARGIPRALVQNYESFAADFGPLPLTEIVKFCKHLDREIDHPHINKSRPVIFYSDANPKVVTNTVLLLCCYLVLRQGLSPEQAAERFECIPGLPVIYFCDARPATIANKHPISVMDCLQGLTRAIGRGLWAEESFDVEAAEWLYNYDTFDLSIVTPKIIAFSCPNTVLGFGGKLNYFRRPEKYVELFNRIRVTDIVRLNDDETYDPEEFRRAGFKWLDLSFPDCSCPSLGIVERFLDLCDKAEGRVAIHCLAGLARTGTLICCDLIKNHGFTALEAVGYLRLARPGSVIDVQHEFLRMVESFEWDGNRPLVPDGWGVDHHLHLQGPALVAGPIRSSRAAPV